MPPLAPGGVLAPTTITFLKMPGTELYGTPISISPFCPKAEAAAPVFASSAIKRRPAMKKIRGGVRPSPCQYATPRLEGAPPVTGACQISLPVSASSASTRSRPGKYITPSMTIGVVWELTFATAAAPRPPAAAALLWMRNVQAGARVETFVRLIWRNGEYPVPARSRRYAGQSASLRAVRGAWAPPEKEKPAVSRATATNTRSRLPNGGQLNVRAHEHPHPQPPAATEPW